MDYDEKTVHYIYHLLYKLHESGHRLTLPEAAEELKIRAGFPFGFPNEKDFEDA